MWFDDPSHDEADDRCTVQRHQSLDQQKSAVINILEMSGDQ